MIPLDCVLCRYASGICLWFRGLLFPLDFCIWGLWTDGFPRGGEVVISAFW